MPQQHQDGSNFDTSAFGRFLGRVPLWYKVLTTLCGISFEILWLLIGDRQTQKGIDSARWKWKVFLRRSSHVYVLSGHMKVITCEWFYCCLSSLSYTTQSFTPILCVAFFLEDKLPTSKRFPPVVFCTIIHIIHCPFISSLRVFCHSLLFNLTTLFCQLLVDQLFKGTKFLVSS